MSKLSPVIIAHKSDIPAVQVQKWQGLKANEAGEPVNSAVSSTISIQVEGRFEGFKVQIQGSNDGETWYTLLDWQDGHMIFTEPGIADVGQVSRYLRPQVIEGDEFTDVTVWLVGRSF